jgi:hypothetical protein
MNRSRDEAGGLIAALQQTLLSGSQALCQAFFVRCSKVLHRLRAHPCRPGAVFIRCRSGSARHACAPDNASPPRLCATMLASTQLRASDRHRRQVLRCPGPWSLRSGLAGPKCTARNCRSGGRVAVRPAANAVGSRHSRPPIDARRSPGTRAPWRVFRAGRSRSSLLRSRGSSARCSRRRPRRLASADAARSGRVPRLPSRVPCARPRPLSGP